MSLLHQDVRAAERARARAAREKRKRLEKTPGVRFQIHNVMPLQEGPLPVIPRDAIAEDRRLARTPSSQTCVLVTGRTLEGESVSIQLPMSSGFFLQVPWTWSESQARKLGKFIGAEDWTVERRVRLVYYTPHLPTTRDKTKPQEMPYVFFWFKSAFKAKQVYRRFSTKNGLRKPDEFWKDQLCAAGLNDKDVDRNCDRNFFSAHYLSAPVQDFFYAVDRHLHLKEGNLSSFESWITLSAATSWLSAREYFANSTRNAFVEIKNIIACENTLESAPLVRMSFDVEQFSARDPVTGARGFPEIGKPTDEVRNISCAVQTGDEEIINIALCVGHTVIESRLASITDSGGGGPAKRKATEKGQGAPAQKEAPGLAGLEQVVMEDDSARDGLPGGHMAAMDGVVAWADEASVWDIAGTGSNSAASRTQPFAREDSVDAGSIVRGALAVEARRRPPTPTAPAGAPPPAAAITAGGIGPLGIRVVCFGTELELLLYFASLIASFQIDVLTGYNIIGYDLEVVFGRLYMYYMCKKMPFSLLHKLSKTAPAKIKRFVAMDRARPPWAERKQFMSNEFGVAGRDANLMQPPLKYVIMGKLKEPLTRADYDFFRSTGPPLAEVDKFFFCGRVPTQEVGYKDHLYETSAHGQLMLRQWTGANFGILCMWMFLKRSTYKLDSYSLKNALKTFFPRKEEYHKLDLDYDDMFQAMEEMDPVQLGEVAKYCTRDAEAVIFLMKRLTVESDMRQKGSLVRTSLEVQCDCGMQRLIWGALQAECQFAYVMNNFVPEPFDYEGATVIEPIVGFYEDPVATLDYASLYPSIMQMRNICTSTLIRPGTKPPPDLDVETITIEKEHDGTVTKAASFVQPKKHGVVPRLLTRLLGARRAVKKQMKDEKSKMLYGTLNSKQLALKILCNSLYGFYGVKSGRCPMARISAAVTSEGRRIIEEETKRRVEDTFGWRVVYGDSVTGDTPLVVRIGGVTRIVPIGRLRTLLSGRRARFRGKQFLEPDDLEVWTERGWTGVKRVISHVTTKAIVRVQTGSGVVDCTTDHSLLRPDGSKASPSAVNVGDPLLHSPQVGGEFAKNSSTRTLTGRQVEILAKRAVRVPQTVLCGPLDVALAFYNTFPGGCVNKELLAGLRVLEERLGIAGHGDPRIKKVTELKPAGPPVVVYDLETASHHFGVAPGNLVVHNTDSIMVELKGLDMKEAWTEAEKLAAFITNDVLGAYESMTLEAEKVNKYWVVFKKKRYVGLANENPRDVTDVKLDYKGLQLKRRDSSKYVKCIMAEMVDVMMPLEGDGRVAVTGPKLSKILSTWLDKLVNNELGVEYFSTTSTAKQDYKSAELPAHMRVYAKYNERIMIGKMSGMPYASGTRVPFVIVEDALADDEEAKRKRALAKLKKGKTGGGRRKLSSALNKPSDYKVGDYAEDPSWFVLHNQRVDEKLAALRLEEEEALRRAEELQQTAPDSEAVKKMDCMQKEVHGCMQNAEKEAEALETGKAEDTTGVDDAQHWAAVLRGKLTELKSANPTPRDVRQKFRKKRAALLKTKFKIDRLHYLRLASNAVTELLRFHLPFADQMFQDARGKIKRQMHNISSARTIFQKKAAAASNVVPGMSTPAACGRREKERLAKEQRKRRSKNAKNMTMKMFFKKKTKKP